MSTISVVRGVGRAGTAMASYDAALADANVHNYNLVTVSSVVPAEATVELVETAPDLGPAGNRLTVVQSKATRAPGESGAAVAGIGWARSESGRGIFYEATGDDTAAVRDTIERGLAGGQELRDWTFIEEDAVVRETAASADEHTALVVCAVYGQSTPIL